MVSNGRKYILDISSLKKFEKIWKFHEIEIDFIKNCALIQASNSGIRQILEN